MAGPLNSLPDPFAENDEVLGGIDDGLRSEFQAGGFDLTRRGLSQSGFEDASGAAEALTNRRIAREIDEYRQNNGRDPSRAEINTRLDQIGPEYQQRLSRFQAESARRRRAQTESARGDEVGSFGAVGRLAGQAALGTGVGVARLGTLIARTADSAGDVVRERVLGLEANDAAAQALDDLDQNITDFREGVQQEITLPGARRLQQTLQQQAQDDPDASFGDSAVRTLTTVLSSPDRGAYIADLLAYGIGASASGGLATGALRAGANAAAQRLGTNVAVGTAARLNGVAGIAAGQALVGAGEVGEEVRQQYLDLDKQGLLPNLPDFQQFYDTIDGASETGVPYEEARDRYIRSRATTGRLLGGALTGITTFLAPSTEAAMFGFGRALSSRSTGPFRDALPTAPGNVVARVAGGAAREGAFEAVEEVGQQAIPNFVGGLEQDEAALGQAAATGLLAGTASGGAVGAFQRNPSPDAFGPPDLTPEQEAALAERRSRRLPAPNPFAPAPVDDAAPATPGAGLEAEVAARFARVQSDGLVMSSDLARAAAEPDADPETIAERVAEERTARRRFTAGTFSTADAAGASGLSVDDAQRLRGLIQTGDAEAYFAGAEGADRNRLTQNALRYANSTAGDGDPITNVDLASRAPNDPNVLGPVGDAEVTRGDALFGARVAQVLRRQNVVEAGFEAGPRAVFGRAGRTGAIANRDVHNGAYPANEAFETYFSDPDGRDFAIALDQVQIVYREQGETEWTNVDEADSTTRREALTKGFAAAADAQNPDTDLLTVLDDAEQRSVSAAAQRVEDVARNEITTSQEAFVVAAAQAAPRLRDEQAAAQEAAVTYLRTPQAVEAWQQAVEGAPRNMILPPEGVQGEAAAGAFIETVVRRASAELEALQSPYDEPSANARLARVRASLNRSADLRASGGETVASGSAQMNAFVRELAGTQSATERAQLARRVSSALTEGAGAVEVGGLSLEQSGDGFFASGGPAGTLRSETPASDLLAVAHATLRRAIREQRLERILERDLAVRDGEIYGDIDEAAIETAFRQTGQPDALLEFNPRATPLERERGAQAVVSALQTTPGVDPFPALPTPADPFAAAATDAAALADEAAALGQVEPAIAGETLLEIAERVQAFPDSHLNSGSLHGLREAANRLRRAHQFARSAPINARARFTNTMARLRHTATAFEAQTGRRVEVPASGEPARLEGPGIARARLEAQMAAAATRSADPEVRVRAAKLAQPMLSDAEVASALSVEPTVEQINALEAQERAAEPAVAPEPEPLASPDLIGPPQTTPGSKGQYRTLPENPDNPVDVIAAEGGVFVTANLPPAVAAFAAQLHADFGVKQKLVVAWGPDLANRPIPLEAYPYVGAAAARAFGFMGAKRVRGTKDLRQDLPVLLMVNDRETLVPGSGSTRLADLEIVAHEFGHLLEHTALLTADQATKDAIRSEYDNRDFATVRSGRQVTRGEVLERDAPALVRRAQLRGLRADPSRRSEADTILDAPASRYEDSFSEWFANNVARALTTDERAHNIVEQFFQSIARQWRRIADKMSWSLYSERGGTSVRVREFLAVVEARVSADSVSLDQDTEADLPPPTDARFKLGGPVPNPIDDATFRRRIEEQRDALRGERIAVRGYDTFQQYLQELGQRYAGTTQEDVVRRYVATTPPFAGQFTQRENGAEVVLIREAIADEAALERVLSHEIVGHYRMADVLSPARYREVRATIQTATRRINPELYRMRQQVEREMLASLRKSKNFDAAEARRVLQTPPMVEAVADEVLGNLAERLVDGKPLAPESNRLVSAIQEGLDAAGVPTRNAGTRWVGRLLQIARDTTTGETNPMQATARQAQIRSALDQKAGREAFSVIDETWLQERYRKNLNSVAHLGRVERATRDLLPEVSDLWAEVRRSEDRANRTSAAVAAAMEPDLRAVAEIAQQMYDDSGMNRTEFDRDFMAWLNARDYLDRVPAIVLNQMQSENDAFNQHRAELRERIIAESFDSPDGRTPTGDGYIAELRRFAEQNGVKDVLAALDPGSDAWRNITGFTHANIKDTTDGLVGQRMNDLASKSKVGGRTLDDALDGLREQFYDAQRTSGTYGTRGTALARALGIRHYVPQEARAEDAGVTEEALATFRASNPELAQAAGADLGAFDILKSRAPTAFDHDLDPFATRPRNNFLSPVRGSALPPTVHPLVMLQVKARTAANDVATQDLHRRIRDAVVATQTAEAEGDGTTQFGRAATIIRDFDLTTPEGQDSFREQIAQGNMIVAYDETGDATLMEVNDAALLSAATDRHITQARVERNAVVRTFGQSTRFLGRLHTSLDPMFVVFKQFVRDLPEAALVAGGGEQRFSPAAAARVAGEGLQNVRWLMPFFLRGPEYQQERLAEWRGQPAGSWERNFAEFVDAGGRQAFSQGIDDVVAGLAGGSVARQEFDGARTPFEFIGDATRTAAGAVGRGRVTGRDTVSRSAVRRMEGFTNAFDNATRFALFNEVRRQKTSGDGRLRKSEATTQAIEVSNSLLPFNRRSELSRQLSPFFAFFNVAVASTDAALTRRIWRGGELPTRTVRVDGGRTQVRLDVDRVARELNWPLAGFVAMKGFVATALALQFVGADEEDGPEEGVDRMRIATYMGGTVLPGTVAAGRDGEGLAGVIPEQLGVTGQLNAIGAAMALAMFSDYEWSDIALNLGVAATKNLTPVNFDTSADTGNLMADFTRMFTPTLANTLNEVIFDTNRFNNPVRRLRDGQSASGVPQSTRFSPGVLAMSRALEDALAEDVTDPQTGQVIGQQPGSLGLFTDPGTLKWMTDQAGAFGDLARTSLDTWARFSTGESIEAVPMLARTTGLFPGTPQYATRSGFYRYVENIEDARNTFRALAKQDVEAGDAGTEGVPNFSPRARAKMGPRASAFIDTLPEGFWDAKKAVDKGSPAIGKIKQQVDNIRRGPDPDPERIADLLEEETMIYREALDLLRDAFDDGYEAQLVF